MVTSSINTMKVKQINKNNVYKFIYKEGFTSKLQTVSQLQMGLSTVSQNIKALEEEGLIQRNGTLESTGGRKADMFEIVRTARISIGIGILKAGTLIVAIDLYGTVLYSATLDLVFESTTDFYKKLAYDLEQFIEANGIDPNIILGVSVATHGIISSDGQYVSYGVLMNNSDMRLSHFDEYIPYPCHIEHDCKAAAYLELWNHEEIDNAILLLLNRNFGGSLIINKAVHRGDHMHAGAIEHMCINKDGPLCYCGDRGCLDTYCSAQAIEVFTGLDVQTFFEQLRAGDPKCVRFWEDYLDKLAFAIRNLSIIIDGYIIISGYLAPYFIKSDVDYLHKASSPTPFPIAKSQFIVGNYGLYTCAAGAALYYVNQFIESI